VNDQITIHDLNAKVNYQLNSANKFQFQFATDNKIRNHRSASSTTAPEATYKQYSPGGWLADMTPQFTHTLVLTDKLVFTNQVTYVHNVFSLDYQDWDTGCGTSTYGRTPPTSPTCGWNLQPQTLRTTSFQSVGPTQVQYFERPEWEVHSDGNYFLSHFLAGDHALKFGVGWRTTQSLSFTHYGGGANVTVQCVGNVPAGCGAGLPVPVGSPTGYVPYQAVLRRDSLANNRWTTYYSYIQDSYSRGKLRINGGVRQDWQTSKFLGGCVDANVIRPDLLPQQCQGAADPHHPFNNFSPRVSVTYDLRGNGKTAIHGSYSYYYDTQTILSSGLSNLGNVNLTWGPNQSSGQCSTTANAPCWTDANHDNIIQANELQGTPTASTPRFDPNTGILSNVLPVVDPNVQIGRTREGIIGVDHEIASNIHVAVDFIDRYYDRGTTTYNIGYQPGCDTSTQWPCTGVGFPQSQLYTGPLFYTDATSGKTAPYYVVCQGCTRPSGAAGTTITGTNLGYSTFKGATVSLQRRLVNRWQAQASFSWNDSRSFSPYGSYTDPQGIEFTNGFYGTGSNSGPNGNPRYQVKVFGSAQLPWLLSVGGNLQVVDGGIRSETINGPGSVYGGTTGTISRSTLTFEPLGSARLPALKQLDMNVARVVKLSGKAQVTLTLDCFNIFNANMIRSYASNNLSNANYNAISAIVPPRVFRVGARIAF
jgi:hypothetical protein